MVTLLKRNVTQKVHIYTFYGGVKPVSNIALKVYCIKMQFLI